ncbi:MAG: cyclic nucleotide-binding domain-containing protein [Parachlamydiaceae bacterium]
MKYLTLIDKAFLLKRTTPFSSLDLDLLLTVADKLTLVVFDPGDYIFAIEEEANRMYFIAKGKVQIQGVTPSPLHTLGTGDFFGEEALFNNSPRAYAAFTPIETHLLTLSRTNLYTIISECPSVAVGFLQVYTSRVPLRPFKPMESET